MSDDDDEVFEIVNLKTFFTPDSILSHAASIGIEYLDSETLFYLAEDVRKKLINVLKINRNNGMVNKLHQTKLTQDMLDMMFEIANVDKPIGCRQPRKYKYNQEANVICLEDKCVNFVATALNSSKQTMETKHPVLEVLYDPVIEMKLNIDSKIVDLHKRFTKNEFDIDFNLMKAVEDKYGSLNSSTKTNSCSYIDLHQIFHDSKEPPSDKLQLAILISYLCIAKILTSLSSPKISEVLVYLQTSPIVPHITPYLLNLVFLLLKHSARSGKMLDMIITVIEALLDNEHVDLSSSYSSNLVARTLFAITLEPITAQNCDDFALRRKSSLVITKLFETCNISPALKEQLHIQLESNIKDPEKKAFKTSYGTITLLSDLGPVALRHFLWPVVDKHISTISSFEKIISRKRNISLIADICHMKSALLTAAVIMYRSFGSDCKFIKNLYEHHGEFDSINSTVEQLFISTYYQQYQQVNLLLIEAFGDTLDPLRLICTRQTDEPVFKMSNLYTRYENCPQSEKYSRLLRYMLIDTLSRLKSKHEISLQKVKKCQANQSCRINHIPFTLSDISFKVFKVFEFRFIKRYYPLMLFRSITSVQREIPRLLKLDSRYNTTVAANYKPSSHLIRVKRLYKYTTKLHKQSCVGDLFNFI